MTPSIQLRPFTRAEYHDFFEGYEADPRMDPRPYRYRYEHVDQRFDAEQERFDWYPTFSIFRTEDDRCLGCLSLKRIDQENATCELGIILQNDSVKGHGYGTAAVAAGVHMAHDRYGVRVITAETAENNIPMQRVLEKTGFRLVKRIPYGFDLVDHWEDKLCYTLEVDA